MGGDTAKAAARLGADRDVAARFAAAFPDDPRVTDDHIPSRLVSPEASADRVVT
jgi:hypothetical protein